MMYIVETNLRSVEAVHTYTHTSNLEKNSKKDIYEKGNIILLCGYYDTG